MRTRTTVMLGVLAAMIVPGILGGTAAATPPVELSSDYVTDDAGVLSSSELAAANARLDELAAGDNGDLYVVLVDEFTNPSGSTQWADETAVSNGLGADQYLIAVAVEAGQYSISADEAGPLGDGEIDHVLQAMEDGLKASDWDGAIIAAADAFPGQPGAAGGGLGGILWILIPLACVIVAIVFIVRAVRGRKKRREGTRSVPNPNDPYASVSDDDLATQAGGALVEADDAITSSRQEVGFAIAQYGEDSTATFTEAVDAAAQKVSEAFALKQKIDDEVPDTDQQRRAWHIQIIELCDEADDLLDDNVEAFEQLRALEAEAPEALQRLKTRRAAAATTLAAAPAALEKLSQTYDAAALAPVTENVAQAQQRLSLADTEIADADALIAEDNRGEAAFAIRTAEEAVAQSEQLTAAVANHGTHLASLEEQAQALITDLEADIAAASALPQAAAQLAPVIARTRSNIDTARTQLQGAGRNPQQILDGLDAANTHIDEIVGSARDAAAQQQRTQRALEQRLIQAQAQISAANDFIMTRRGAIGAQARTRLAEANAAYAEAISLQASDPTQATERASRAYNLANQALSAANSEVSSFNAGGWGGGGWSSSGWGSTNRSSGSGLGGDILGGILGGLFSGGGGGSSGWSSSSSRRRSSRSSSRASSFGSSRRSSSRSRSSSRGRSSRGRRF
ncbi:TPM domain-containing protein [Microbacterium sp.]|uniref:TPM domain-containing protein n=1 Tax=Microbacterium sp. TaxID=51671 RepID=UPI00262765D3|nr:TPM domain-containing protein [Microbacterium sp.]